MTRRLQCTTTTIVQPHASTNPGSRIPLCLVPNALVQYLRTALGVLTTENQRAAVRIVQAGLRGLYLMERARAAQIAYHMALLGISTPTTLHTHRGIPIETVRCEACGTNVTSCWELRASDGPAAMTAIEKFLSTHNRGATLTAMRKHPDFKVVANTLWARYTATVRREGILACWPCTAPTAWELHCTSLNTNPIARPQNLPVRRPTAPRLATRERDREANQTQDDSLQQYDRLKRTFFRVQRSRIRDGHRVDTTGGLACAQTTLRHWRAPHTLPSRAPYGHGALLRRAVGGDFTPGEVCMVAPSPQDCDLSPDRLPADSDLKAYLSHPCGVRITGTDTTPAYTYTMTFSMVSIAEAYSMTGEPPPSNLRPTTAPLDPSRTDPGQVGAPGTTRLSPLPSPSPATPRENDPPPSSSPTSKRARARARASTQSAQNTPHATAVAEHDWANQADPPTTVAGGIEVEYARISHVISTALHNGDARPCHKQARAVLDTHRDCSAKRRREITPLPEARAHYRYRALALILHPDRTAPELLRHRTMARLAWDAVQTARAYLEHSGQVDELFPLEQRRPPTTPFTGLWLPVPRADSAAFLTALHHTPANLVPTGPRRLPNRLVRTTSLSLARPAPAMDRGTSHASSPVTNPSPIIMSRSHSLPSRVPPAWHATPVILDFSHCDHDDRHVAEGQTPGEPQCRPLLLKPDTRTAPLLQHNLDLVLNDSDARFIASRHATTAAPIVGVDTRADPLEFRLSHHCTTGLDRAPCPIA